MSKWSELRDTRKTLLGIAQLAVLMILIAAVGQWYTADKVRDQQHRVHSAELALRQAEPQLEAYKLGDQSDLFTLSNLRSMSPLPNTPGFMKCAAILNTVQERIDGLMQSEKAWKELSEKSEVLYGQLMSLAAEKETTKSDGLFVQTITLAARAIHDWLQAPPADPVVRAMEMDYLNRKVKEADSLIEANRDNPRTLKMRQSWESWMNAVQEQLLEEKVFFEQKKTAMNLLSGYAIALEEEALRMNRMTSQSSWIYLILFAGLSLVIVFLLRALYSHPQLNSMFADHGMQALQASLEEISEHVDQILAAVDRAWLDSRKELKELGEAIKDSDVLDSEIRNLKAMIGNLVASVDESLRDLETRLRGEYSSAELADHVASLLAQWQSGGAAVMQSLESLGNSGMSIQHELRDIQKSIKKLAQATQTLKREGEVLEDRSQTLQSAVE